MGTLSTLANATLLEGLEDGEPDEDRKAGDSDDDDDDLVHHLHLKP